jgi:hypothetical protein
MTPERIAGLVTRWVRFYTRNLPESVARRRVDEIEADLHEHIAHARAERTGDRRTAASIAARMVRGLAADASWRSRMIARSPRKDPTKMHTPASRSAVRIALLTTAVLLMPLVAMQFTDEVDWGVFDFVFAGALLAGVGVLCELAARKPANFAYRAIATAIGVAAIVAGQADDAPGLVLFGGLLIVGTIALAAGAVQRSD